MNRRPSDQPLLTFPPADSSPLSIRARALVFVDPRTRRLRKVVEGLAPTSLPLLIRGETGTGKELLAHAIHAASLRGNKPFVGINVAAIPDNLLETEFLALLRGLIPARIAMGGRASSSWPREGHCSSTKSAKCR